MQVAKKFLNGIQYTWIVSFQTGDDRITLSWAEEPQDLDLNLFICDEGCQVFWDDRSCANANLDVDDRDGGGPETITLNSQMPAPLDQTYVAWVCNFIIF